MSSDPLSDALSQPAESVTTPATSTAPDSRASDLFAAPFQSSTWTEPHVATDHAALERDSGVRGVLSGESDATREPTALNAQAPSFIPSFAIPSTTLPFGDDATSPESTRASVADLETAETGHEADPATSRAENSAKQEERPSLSVSTGGPEPSRSPSSASAYSPSTLRDLVAQSCQAGDLHRLQSLLAQQPDSEERFGLANSINSTTGIAPIHHAAKKGHVEVVRWLVEECGAIVGLEDADGETALHKACLSGRVETAEWLLAKEGTEVDGVDNDGWTALHNASSLGSLPLVNLLLSRGASLSPLSSHGFTPLMNAASKGHLPAVHLLLKRGADPLVRNQWGETAFDLAAGVFEVRICEVLESYEKVAWGARRDKAKREGRPQDAEYSVLGLHSTVPVVLHENQRLVTPSLATFPTLSKFLDSGNPKWTSKALSRNDRRAAFSLPDHVLKQLTGELPNDEDSHERACFRSEVGLPLIGRECHLVVPERREIRSGGRVKLSDAARASRSQSLKKKKQTPSQASSSLSTILASTSSSPPVDEARIASDTSRETPPAWVWLSSWTIDLSSPLSSPVDGWSYSQSFETPSHEWQPSLPFGAPGNANKWVRRRRWVRLMKRRVDLKGWGFLDTSARDNGDYRAKAQSIIDQHRRQEAAEDDERTEEARSRKSIIALERAAQELRSGIESDEDEARRKHAQSDLEAVLGRIALLKLDTSSRRGDDSGDDSEDEFVYRGRDAGEDEDEDTRSIWTTTRPSSLRTPSASRPPEGPASDYFSTAPSHSEHPDLTPQLAQNPDFRIPTDEHASAYPTISRSSSGQYSQHRTTWEPDEAAQDCRRCGTGFSFFKRKHHCRRCGLVCCANCTTHKDPIDPYLVVREPGIPPTSEDLQPWALSSPLLYRTCDSCHAALALAQGLPANHPSSILSPQSFFPRTPSIGSVTPSDTNESEASELSECPCCGAQLGTFGDRANQEAHVRKCLDQGEGSISSGRYLVFNLPPGPLVGEDCGICFTEFEVNDRMARLVCLCTFHEACIRAWLSRGHSCPVHVPRED